MQQNSNDPPEATVELLLLDDIRFDESYQRGEKANSKKMGRNFDPLASGVPTVARRADGTLYGVDGRQRFTAMRMAGIDRWQCFVVPSSGPEFEASLFSKINRDRVKVSQAEQFHAALTAGDPIAHGAKRAAESCGLTIPLSSGGMREARRAGKYITCHGTLYLSVKAHGEEVLRRTLHLLTRTWPMDSDAVSMYMVIGAVAMVVAHFDKIDDERFIRILGKKPVQVVIQDASRSIVRHKSSAIRRTLIEMYNVRLTKKLDDASGRA